MDAWSFSKAEAVWRHQLAPCPACGGAHDLRYLALQGGLPPQRLCFICPSHWHMTLLCPQAWVRLEASDAVAGIEVIEV